VMVRQTLLTWDALSLTEMISSGPPVTKLPDGERVIGMQAGMLMEGWKVPSPLPRRMLTSPGGAAGAGGSGYDVEVSAAGELAGGQGKRRAGDGVTVDRRLERPVALAEQGR